MAVQTVFDGWNRAHKGAYLKGVAARKAGEPISACPYDDTRKGGGSRGQLSWSRSFITAWRDGWRDADKETQP
jgi:hypothetical protein